MPDIERAFAAADLVISRAGAATLAEYPEHALPAILVPYPYAWRYQRVNADWLAERGAAIRLDEDRLAAELLPMIRDLLGRSGAAGSDARGDGGAQTLGWRGEYRAAVGPDGKEIIEPQRRRERGDFRRKAKRMGRR